MSNYYTKNFDPALFYGEDGAIPRDDGSKNWLRLKDSNWIIWLNGKEDKIPDFLATNYWFEFTAMLIYFSDYHGSLTFNSSLEHEAALNKYTQELREALASTFQRIKSCIKTFDRSREQWFFTSPFEFESAMEKECNYISMMAAYSIMQMDEAITGLLDNDTIKAASCSHNASVGLSCISGQIRLGNIPTHLDNNSDQMKPLPEFLKREIRADLASEHARKGGEGKAAKYQPLKDLAKELVNNRNWKSRRNAAMTIMPEILQKSKELNIRLSEHYYNYLA